ncbi:HGGxSTG domain-containing protein [Methylomonas koyamae]|uniref:HGGxSTG domain-containing protein n=1 Tax=Methylomonas koyamae TaxID=702114 RepID=UPI0035713B94
MTCGAKTRAGTPCQQKAIFANGRCKWHGGCSTGPKTEAGKQRAALNGKRHSFGDR